MQAEQAARSSLQPKLQFRQMVSEKSSNFRPVQQEVAATAAARLHLGTAVPPPELAFDVAPPAWRFAHQSAVPPAAEPEWPERVSG